MKKLATILLLVIGINSYGQQGIIKGAVPAPIKDSTAKPPAYSDTVKILSVNDLMRIVNPLKKEISAEAYENWMEVMKKIVATSVREWNEKQKQLANKTK